LYVTTKMQRDEETNGLRIKVNENGTRWIYGNTFVIKDSLKNAGGLWDSESKGWLMPAEFNGDLNRMMLEAKGLIEANFATREETDGEGNRVELPPLMKLIVHCNAFKVKEQIKASGGVWDWERKGWAVPYDFDESIIPPDERPRDEDGNVVRRKPKCSFCGSEDHKKNMCPCGSCGMNGLHKPEDCPKLNPLYKSSGQNCHCSPYGLCDVCLPKE
jgi:hypothetical protein